MVHPLDYLKTHYLISVVSVSVKSRPLGYAGPRAVPVTQVDTEVESYFIRPEEAAWGSQATHLTLSEAISYYIF